MLRKIVIAILLSLVFSCATTDEKDVSDQTQQFESSGVRAKAREAHRPEWAKIRRGERKGESHFFVGESSGRVSRQDAADSAFLNALAEVSMYFGVKVETEMRDLQTERDGAYSYYIGQKNVVTGKPIVLRNPQKDKEHIEEYREEGKTLYSAIIIVSVPSAEINRLEREMKGLYGWGVIADSEDVKRELSGFIKSFASRNKIRIVPEQTLISSLDTLSDISQKSDTAFFYRLNLEHEVTSMEDGKYSAKVKLTKDQFSLTERTVISTKTQIAEAEARTEKGALMDAVKEAVKRIQVEKVETEKQISVSPALNLKYLGTPAVASFTITEHMHYMEGGSRKVAERKHGDNMNISSAFEAGLMNHNIKPADRQVVDQELARLNLTASELINRNSIHGIKIGVDASILIVGEYFLNFDSEGAAQEMQDFNRVIKPEQVNFQAVHIKGFDLRSGTVVFDIYTKHNTVGKALHQRQFIGFAAKLLFDEVNKISGGSK
jgi:hypothetical protein